MGRGRRGRKSRTGNSAADGAGAGIAGALELTGRVLAGEGTGAPALQGALGSFPTPQRAARDHEIAGGGLTAFEAGVRGGGQRAIGAVSAPRPARVPTRPGAGRVVPALRRATGAGALARHKAGEDAGHVPRVGRKGRGRGLRDISRPIGGLRDISRPIRGRAIERRGPVGDSTGRIDWEEATRVRRLLVSVGVDNRPVGLVGWIDGNSDIDGGGLGQIIVEAKYAVACEHSNGGYENYPARQSRHPYNNTSPGASRGESDGCGRQLRWISANSFAYRGGHRAT
jgi:hypothetical protein